MRIKNRTRYSTQQWKSFFSTLFISTTLVLILLLIAINLKYSSINIARNALNDQTLVISFKAELEPLDKFVIEREVNELNWVNQLNFNPENQLIITLKEPLESIESINQDLAKINFSANIAYPRLLNEKARFLFNSTEKSSTLLLVSIAIISWIFSFLILKSLLYSKRKHIYYLKLVGSSKSFLLKKHLTTVFWCSLAAGLTAIIIVSTTVFTLSIIDTSSLVNLNINGLFIGLIITPLWAIVINGVNSWYIISNIYEQNKKQIYSI